MTLEGVVLALGGYAISGIAAYFSATTRAAMAELRSEFKQDLANLRVEMAHNYERKAQIHKP